MLFRSGEQAQEPALSAEPSSTSSPDSEARPVGAEQTPSPAPLAAPAANPPKSWASLFHNSKPLPGGPQGFVEVKNVVEVVAPSPATPEQPEKAGEVKESPVHVSEDPMAPKLAGSVYIYWVCHRVCHRVGHLQSPTAYPKVPSALPFKWLVWGVHGNKN